MRRAPTPRYRRSPLFIVIIITRREQSNLSVASVDQTFVHFDEQKSHCRRSVSTWITSDQRPYLEFVVFLEVKTSSEKQSLSFNLKTGETSPTRIEKCSRRSLAIPRKYAALTERARVERLSNETFQPIRNISTVLKFV